MRIHSSARVAVIVGLLIAFSAVSFAQVNISVNFGPPPIPVYVQPPCPSEGYMWVPGYWAYDPSFGDYYWVPGTWVQAPQPGYLWTPGWWGWGGSAFLWHSGYWGPRVGFYGGINYGFGYFGNGYEGGRWDHDRFYYNRSVTNVNVTHITNVYNTTIINNNVTRVSYNGGNGGLHTRPTAEQEQIEHEHHLPPIAAQTQHVQEARGNPELRASANHGKPPIAATARPNEFKGEGAVPAKEAGGEYHPPANREGKPENHGEANVPKPPTATHAKDLPPHEKMPAPNTGDDKMNAKYQQQQDKMYAKQEQEHQKLAQQQEKQHQQMAKQQANEQKQQQMEMKHQQQTQQMEQRHAQQEQKMQMREAPYQQGGGGHPPEHH